MVPKVTTLGPGTKKEPNLICLITVASHFCDDLHSLYSVLFEMHTTAQNIGQAQIEVLSRFLFASLKTIYGNSEKFEKHIWWNQFISGVF